MVFILFYIYFFFCSSFSKRCHRNTGQAAEKQKEKQYEVFIYLFILLSYRYRILLFLCCSADDDDKDWEDDFDDDDKDDYSPFGLFSPVVENFLLSLYFTLRYIRLLSFQGEVISLINSILIFSNEPNDLKWKFPIGNAP